MLATQMPDMPPEAQDVKQVKPQAFAVCAKILLPWIFPFLVVVFSSFTVTVIPQVKVSDRLYLPLGWSFSQHSQVVIFK